ncbi:MAG: 5-(carboxyamino)imidazole ribonucleotide mutase [Fusobacterium sp.]|nr:5-(carboxyamino)imidazole ribonucleotide mutase [Fusobacterium sp.]
MKVAIFFGSQSDKDKMKGAATCLKEFDIEFEAYVLSAHRVPEKLEEVLVDVEKRGAEVIIAGAGLAAHLPGVIASKTLLPVVGVPLNGAIGGLDALYSIVQMPKSIPVATVGIDNSYNAGMVAIQILAIKYPELRQKLFSFRKNMKVTFIANNGKVDL